MFHCGLQLTIVQIISAQCLSKIFAVKYMHRKHIVSYLLPLGKDHIGDFKIYFLK